MPLPVGYRENILTPRTSRSVEAVWTFVALEAGTSLVLPDGRCDIIVRDNLQETVKQQLIVTGPGTEPYSVHMRAGDRWRGLRLRPENGAVIWRDHLRFARNAVLRDTSAQAKVPNAPKHILQADDLFGALPFGCDQNTRITAVIDAIHTAGGRLSVAHIARMLSWSVRHLNRVFTAHVGLPPKIYAQLVQFHRALRLLKNNGLQIADAAFEAGYADHAHMTRNFQRFGGFPPSQIPKDLFVPKLFVA